MTERVPGPRSWPWGRELLKGFEQGSEILNRPTVCSLTISNKDVSEKVG